MKVSCSRRGGGGLVGCGKGDREWGEERGGGGGGYRLRP